MLSKAFSFPSETPPDDLIRELEMASSIQKNFLAPLPTLPGLECEVSLFPAESVGGDCYDFLETHEQKTLLYIGDVSGHGIPASLLMSMVNALFFTLAQFCSSPKEILIKANELLRKKMKENLFITTLMCDWQAAENRFSYISAGHEQIIHFHNRKKELTICPTGGIALGMLPDIQSTLEEREITLEENDFMILYSDGIPETRSKNEELLGMERFKDIIQKNSHYSSATEIHENILKDVQKFMNGEKQQDDMTLMVIKKKKTA